MAAPKQAGTGVVASAHSSLPPAIVAALARSENNQGRRLPGESLLPGATWEFPEDVEEELNRAAVVAEHTGGHARDDEMLLPLDGKGEAQAETGNKGGGRSGWARSPEGGSSPRPSFGSGEWTKTMRRTLSGRREDSSGGDSGVGGSGGDRSGVSPHRSGGVGSLRRELELLGERAEGSGTGAGTGADNATGLPESGESSPVATSGRHEVQVHAANPPMAKVSEAAFVVEEDSDEEGEGRAVAQGTKDGLVRPSTGQATAAAADAAAGSGTPPRHPGRELPSSASPSNGVDGRPGIHRRTDSDLPAARRRSRIDALAQDIDQGTAGGLADLDEVVEALEENEYLGGTQGQDKTQTQN